MKQKDIVKIPTDKENEAFPILGIGASAGGLDALKELFENLPIDKVSCVVIQHLDPVHKSLLADILSRETRMTVEEAKEGAKLRINCVYTIPPDMVLTVASGVLHLSPRKEMAGLFLPIDRFFQSLARNYDDRAVGIILSGSGSDGSLGIQEIKGGGGIVYAQDQKSSKFFSMPQAAINTGDVDFILSPKAIANHLSQLLVQRYWEKPNNTKSNKLVVEGALLTDVLSYVYKSSGVDFSSYKFPTLSRRILRRMNFSHCESLADYYRLLKAEKAEVKALCQDILIQVTFFFRDEDCFELLKTTLFSGLFKDRPAELPIRIWVAGCSSGEEAYSILISLMEYMTETHQHFPIQLFGTDINDNAILKARSGTYSENAVSNLSPDRLQRFFRKEGNQYVINKSLRDHCIFAKHNMLKDPPFANIDLLSCQNVLIYFDLSLQKRVLGIFHYALKPEGVLLLGRSESASANSDLFQLRKAGTAAYQKLQSHRRLYFDFVGAQHAGENLGVSESGSSQKTELSTGIQVQKEADRLLLQQFSPPGVIFNDKLEVIQFKGHTGPYFEHSPGSASLDLLKMLKGGLIADVKLAIELIRKTEEPVRKEGIKLRVNDAYLQVAIETFPIRVGSTRELHFLLTFEDMDLPSVEIMNQRRLAKNASREHGTIDEEATALRAELNSTRDYLQSVNEEKEASNEELAAANEEILSSNEELQSTNEELHTAKEELQSTNEELLTVNDELQARNQDFIQLNNDLSNLFNSLNVAVIMLNKELRIRKFTPMAEKLLRLIPSDIGRSILDVRFNVEIPELEKKVLGVIQSLSPSQLEAQDSQGKWYAIEIRPYRTADDRIDGAILLFMDINQIKSSLEYAEAIEETIGEPLLILDSALRIKKANGTFHKTFETTPAETDGKLIYELGKGAWNIPELRTLLEEILPKNKALNGFEVSYNFPVIGKKTIHLNARRVFHHDKSTETILLAFNL